MTNTTDIRSHIACRKAVVQIECDVCSTTIQQGGWHVRSAWKAGDVTQIDVWCMHCDVAVTKLWPKGVTPHLFDAASVLDWAFHWKGKSRVADALLARVDAS